MPKITEAIKVSLSPEELKLVWDALSQFSDNRGTDELGEELELPVLDALVERFESHFIVEKNHRKVWGDSKGVSDMHRTIEA